MNKQRLKKIESFLWKLPAAKFNFRDYVSQRDNKGCGTVCCVIGWCQTIFPGEFGALVPGDYPSEWQLASFLGVEAGHVFGLFHPRHHRPWSKGILEYNATKTEVANSIRDFIKWKEMNP